MYNSPASPATPPRESPVLDTLLHRLRHFIWNAPLADAPRPKRALIVALRYGYAVVREIATGELTLRAMSLVYTTLLSVVPLLAFSFSVLKGFGVHKRLEPLLYQVLQPLGERGEEITRVVIERVDNIEGAPLAGLSLAFFIYTAVSMVQKVEESLNFIWRVDRARTIARRFTEYVAVLLVGPMLMVIGIGLLTSVARNAVVKRVLDIQPVGETFALVSNLTPYVLAFLVFTFLYKFMPNTRVKLKSAAIGALTAGVLWGIVGALFTSFVLYSSGRQLVYSSFAIAIVALIWLYVSWLILLLGAQVAFYNNHPAYLRIGRLQPKLSNAVRERLALNIMYLVGRAFREPDDRCTVDSLARRLAVPAITLGPVVDILEEAGLVTLTEQETLIPGREMARIRLADVLATVRKGGETGSYRPPRWSPPVDEIAASLEESVDAVVAERTLSDLLDAAEAESREEARGKKTREEKDDSGAGARRVAKDRLAGSAEGEPGRDATTGRRAAKGETPGDVQGETPREAEGRQN